MPGPGFIIPSCFIVVTSLIIRRNKIRGRILADDYTEVGNRDTFSPPSLASSPPIDSIEDDNTWNTGNNIGFMDFFILFAHFFWAL
jgi:hypothetical protein